MANGNSVNSVNSVRRLSYTAGVPSSAFQARLWPPLALRWHGDSHDVSSSCFLGRPIKLRRRRRSSFLFLCFPDATAATPASPHRRRSAPPSQPSQFQLHLLLAHPSSQLGSPDSAGNPLCEPFFLVAGRVTGDPVSPRPALSGESWLLLSVPTASYSCCGA